MTEDRLTLADLHRSGHCVDGTRKVIEALGIDWRDFRVHGIPIETALRLEGCQPMVQDALRAKGFYDGR